MGRIRARRGPLPTIERNLSGDSVHVGTPDGTVLHIQSESGAGEPIRQELIGVSVVRGPWRKNDLRKLRQFSETRRGPCRIFWAPTYEVRFYKDQHSRSIAMRIGGSPPLLPQTMQPETLSSPRLRR